MPTAARAISRRGDRGNRTEGASSGGGVGRAAVGAPGSQGRGPCGLPARRSERPAERVRGALPFSLASLPTYVQRVGSSFVQRQRAGAGPYLSRPETEPLLRKYWSIRGGSRRRSYWRIPGGSRKRALLCSAHELVRIPHVL